MRSRKLCSNMFFWCVFVTVKVCMSVCMFVLVCVRQREREQERGVFVCVLVDGKDVFLRNSLVFLCKIDFSISSNVAIL